MQRGAEESGRGARECGRGEKGGDWRATRSTSRSGAGAKRRPISLPKSREKGQVGNYIYRGQTVEMFILA